MSGLTEFQSNLLRHCGDASLSIILAFVEAGNVCEIKRQDGTWIHVHSATWGQDMGDPRRHVFVNIGPHEHHGVHHFYIDEIVLVRDVRTGEAVFDRRTIPGLERL